ncbi:MAG TPA: gamma-butyrobetaine hydroxylase-like domain-containing protein [Vitreimonas sp.]|uniref:gamma-butyrobetaine hydroxylase-like domain-containing protein n=1 Tax=Vitreimonas sp. TaxID=3069702 RepID=UPI002D5B58E5|nr:gamma-butyrobetaine hydroxylase-like domain-containing protein [Vitreimonas sp.]HYD87330.1 gamma-butyrobetaine hydroxylase-like domain-containing protein [Vitreimonas sp.]
MTAAAITRPWPTDLVFDRATRQLMIAFDDGAHFEIPFELLRVESPSAENKGHGPNPPPPVTGKANVNVVKADAVGRYAVRISFDDGHDTGLYSWDLLYDLGRTKGERLRIYRETLAQRALRDEA